MSMYATTIEPHLIALLNNAPSEQYTTSPSLELPRLHRPNILTADGRPLLQEPESASRSSNPTPASNAQSVAQQCTTSNPPNDDGEKGHNEATQQSEKAAADRSLGNSSPQSLRKILDNDATRPATVSSRKRMLAENNKDDFVQLPQPPKKQKATKQVVPPIIIGLFEPPPQAALFPPIASSSFHDSHGRNSLNIVPTGVKEVEETPKGASGKDAETKPASAETSKKRNDVRARKKWTEEETDNLLLGVYKHGVGSWTDILEDPSFSFNGRSGADLKDRFRTCCPDELRENNQNVKGFFPQAASKGTPSSKSRSSLMSENILIDEDESSLNPIAGEGRPTKARRSRAHRKKMEDLAHLGISGPFRKSHRRERRHFSQDEDREILEGYNIHGPAWTRIQRDPRFHLQSRQPTDLRDRFRNKYPEKFRPDDKGDTSNKENAPAHSERSPSTSKSRDHGKESLDPNPGLTSSQSSLPSSQSEKASNETGKDEFGKEKAGNAATQSSTLPMFSSREGLRIQDFLSSENEMPKSIPLQTPNPLFGFKDSFGPFSDQPAIDTPEGLPFSQSFDWSSSMTAPFASNMGEMDISRLLLEPWPDNPSSSGKEKQNLADSNSGADHPNIPSFCNLLEGSIDFHESFG